MPEKSPNATLQQQLDDLTAENAALRKQIAAYETAEQTRSDKEKQIAAKVTRGLTRDQAIAVIDRQKAADEAVKKKALGSGRKAETKKALGSGL
jgi:hypothetical protein